MIKESRLRSGARLCIYEDPITEEKPEGQAELGSQIRGVTNPATTGKELQYWRVCFIGDDEDPGYHERWILVEKGK